MHFSVLFKLSLYGMAGAAYLALLLGGGVDPLPLFAYGLALAGSWLVDPAVFRKRAPAHFFTWVVLGVLVLFPVDLLYLSHRDVLIATLHATFLLTLAKLVTAFENRDYVFLYLTAFAQLLAASILTVDISFFICLALFLLSAVSSLMLFDIRRGQRAALAAPGSEERAEQELNRQFRQPRPFLWTALGLGLAILALAAPLFFTLPRPRNPWGLFGRSRGAGIEMVSGFSDRVELGAIGKIKENHQVVMRVKVQASHLSHPLPLKWRGVVLYEYDGRSWARQDREPERYARVPGRLYSLNPRGAGDRLITQTIYLEPLDTDVLFVAPRIVAVSDDVPYLMTDASDSLRTQPHPDHAIRYVAYSDISRPPDEELKYSSVVPVPAVRDYLEVPAGLDPRIRELAFEVTKQLPTHIQKSRELEAYLRTRYAHTLALRGTHKDPLARFLFEVKEGNCEYFASALAVMLRYLGIPTRLVNGFQVGEYNRLGNDYIVRQSDAHTWVEAFFPDGGWIEFDPTPPSSTGSSRGVLLTWLAHAVDAVDLFWTEEVIQYSLWKQVRLFRSVRRSLDRQRDDVRFWYRRWEIRLERWAVRSFRNVRAVPVQRLMLIVALGVGMPFLLWWAFRRWGWRWRLRRSRQPQRAAVVFYGRMLDLLRRRGHPKHAGQTAWEFASSLTIPQREACLRLTALYQQARFSRLPLSPDELRAVEDSLRQLQTRDTRAGDARSPAS